MSVLYTSTSNDKIVDVDLDMPAASIESNIVATAKISGTKSSQLIAVNYYNDSDFTSQISWGPGLTFMSNEMLTSDDDLTYANHGNVVGPSAMHHKVTFRPTADWISAAVSGADPSTGEYDSVYYIQFTMILVSGQERNIGGKLTWNGSKSNFTFQWL